MSSVTAEALAVIPPVIKEAAHRGSPPWAMLELLVSAFDQAYDGEADDKAVQAARFNLAGRAGRLELMKEEGGCVSSAEAAGLYLGPNPTKKPNPETVRKAAREHRLISIRDGLATDCVTDAVLKSARTRKWENVKKA